MARSLFQTILDQDCSKFTFVINGYVVAAVVANEDRTLSFHFMDSLFDAPITIARDAFNDAEWVDPHYEVMDVEGNQHEWTAFKNVSVECMGKLIDKLWDYD